jgi:hypothetical protein
LGAAKSPNPTATQTSTSHEYGRRTFVRCGIETSLPLA